MWRNPEGSVHDNYRSGAESRKFLRLNIWSDQWQSVDSSPTVSIGLLFETVGLSVSENKLPNFS